MSNRTSQFRIPPKQDFLRTDRGLSQEPLTTMEWVNRKAVNSNNRLLTAWGHPTNPDWVCLRTHMRIFQFFLSITVHCLVTIGLQ